MTASETPRIRVGVIDSGWRSAISDPRIEAGQTFFAQDDPFRAQVSSGSPDLIGHGTRCTHVILAVAPTATIVPLRVFGSRLETSPEVLCAALESARSQSLDVVSMSLSTAREDARERMYVLCEDLRCAGTVIVASARNGFADGYPAVFDSVIGVTVGAVGPGGGILRKADGMLDFVVQNGWIGPPLRPGVHAPLVSNSGASAFVAGCVAHLIDADRDVSPGELRQRLETRFGSNAEPRGYSDTNGVA